MAYEVRGSMLVYLVLGVTASFTPTRRFLCLLGIVAYSIYADSDALSDLPFYIGAILADISLVLSDKNITILPLFTCCKEPRGDSRWAIVFAFVALYIGSYPPNSYERATWSQQLYNLGQAIFPSTCTPYCDPLIIS
jgi:hypothetical protein